jgi:diphthine synthase
MLHLVGTGLSEKGISTEGIEACERCSKLYIERYTSIITDAKLRFLESLFGKNITELRRTDMEENSKKLLDEAGRSDIAVLVGGDPLIATTHKILAIKASELGIPIRTYSAASVISVAMGQSGLDFYRFGPIITVPAWSEHYKPTAFCSTIRENMARNLHSILLLDYKSEEQRSLNPKEAIQTLLDAQGAQTAQALSSHTMLIIIKDAGLATEKRLFTSMGDAARIEEKGLFTIIIPAKPTEIEQELIQSLY